MLLVASETGHVYTFATRKLQPMITSDSGKALIQTCLNSPDPPPGSQPQMTMDQRMNPTGFEETELSYAVAEEEHAKVCKTIIRIYSSSYIIAIQNQFCLMLVYFYSIYIYFFIFGVFAF